MCKAEQVLVYLAATLLHFESGFKHYFREVCSLETESGILPGRCTVLWSATLVLGPLDILHSALALLYHPQSFGHAKPSCTLQGNKSLVIPYRYTSVGDPFVVIPTSEVATVCVLCSKC